MLLSRVKPTFSVALAGCASLVPAWYYDWPFLGKNRPDYAKPLSEADRAAYEQKVKATQSKVTSGLGDIIGYRYESIHSLSRLNSENLYLHGYRTHLDFLKFVNCSIRANLEKSDVNFCSFIDCKIELYGDKQGFSYCDFTGSSLSASFFRFGGEGSYVENTIFDKTRWNGNESFIKQEQGPGRFDHCSFKGADLQNVRFKRVAFRGCSFDSADLRGATVGSLVNCSFSDAKLEGLVVEGCMSPWTFFRLWMGGADLSRAFDRNDLYSYYGY